MPLSLSCVNRNGPAGLRGPCERRRWLRSSTGARRRCRGQRPSWERRGGGRRWDRRRKKKKEREPLSENCALERGGRAREKKRKKSKSKKKMKTLFSCACLRFCARASPSAPSPFAREEEGLRFARMRPSAGAAPRERQQKEGPRAWLCQPLLLLRLRDAVLRRFQRRRKRLRLFGSRSDIARISRLSPSIAAPVPGEGPGRDRSGAVCSSLEQQQHGQLSSLSDALPLCRRASRRPAPRRSKTRKHGAALLERPRPLRRLLLIPSFRLRPRSPAQAVGTAAGASRRARRRASSRPRRGEEDRGSRCPGGGATPNSRKTLRQPRQEPHRRPPCSTNTRRGTVDLEDPLAPRRPLILRWLPDAETELRTVSFSLNFLLIGVAAAVAAGGVAAHSLDLVVSSPALAAAEAAEAAAHWDCTTPPPWRRSELLSICLGTLPGAATRPRPLWRSSPARRGGTLPRLGEPAPLPLRGGDQRHGLRPGRSHGAGLRGPWAPATSTLRGCSGAPPPPARSPTARSRPLFYERLDRLFVLSDRAGQRRRLVRPAVQSRHRPDPLGRDAGTRCYLLPARRDAPRVPLGDRQLRRAAPAGMC